MQLLLLFLSVFGVSLCSAQNINFFIVPGSRPAQLNSGNKTSDYPIYRQHASTQLSWNTNWTKVSLVLYQNENSSAIPLFEDRENGPKKYSFDMNPDVNLTWNDVFFLTLWNENQQKEGGPRYFSSSYFRINASDSSSSSPGGGNNNNNNNNNNSKNSNSGLSPAAKIGIGVGVGVGVPVLILSGAVVFYLRRRRSKATAAQTQQQGLEDSPGAGAGGYSNKLPPISEVSGDAAYKAELPDESTTPCRAELPDGSTTPSKQTEPSEVDPTNVGVGVQSRFIELPGN